MLTETIRSQLWQLVEAERRHRKSRDLESIERDIRTAVVAHWNRQRDLVLDMGERILRPLFQEADDDEVDRLWSHVNDQTNDDLQAELDNAYRTAAARGATSVAVDAALDVSFTVDSPEAREFLRNRGAERVTAIDEETRRQLRTIVSNGMDEGWSYQRTAQEIRTRFDGFSDPSALGHVRDRAELVAIQEASEAYEYGRWEQMEDFERNGLQMQKAWLSAEDTKVCDICLPNERGMTGWVPKDDPFPSGHMRPPGHVGCRCDMIIRADPEQKSRLEL
jgi:hypothetical protein